MLPVKDSFLDLERHRVQLEKSIQELERALLYWRKQDAEYEALKDEVESFKGAPDSSNEYLARIRQDFDSQVISKDDIDKIFGDKEAKSPEQIVNVLSHRIDYVMRNIESLSKRLEAVQNQYAAATVVSQPDATDEDGLPITEILEELDDDDNVVSYRLQRPGDAQPQIREVLEKAGVKDLPELNTKPGSESTPNAPAGNGGLPNQPQTQKAVSSSSVDNPETHTRQKKAVSFSNDTKDGPEQAMSTRAQRVAEIMNNAKEQEKLQNKEPLIPDDESEDDAAMRREMLQYAMNEVGPVVAELTLEEGRSDDDFDDEMMDDEYDVDDEDYDEDMDDEDEHGRSKSTAITPEYRRRMMELERRLGVQSRFTQDVTEAPEEPEDLSSNEELSNGREGLGVIKISNQASDVAAQKILPSTTQASTKSSSMKAGENKDAKKAVRFASALDIAPDGAKSEAEAPRQPTRPEVEPLSDVVERTGPAKSSGHTEPKRQSRFRRQRDTPDAPTSRDDFSSFASADGTIPKGPLDMPVRFLNQDRPDAPSGPEGKLLADAIVEHEPSTTAEDPDEMEDALDDAMLHQEVAEEYQRHRKKFVNRQGGFLKENKDPVQSLDEESSRPVSRFKAARLSLS